MGKQSRLSISSTTSAQWSTIQCDDSLGIKRRIAITGSATVSFTLIWNNKAIGKKTKIRLLQSLVFPTALYGCQSWAMKKTGRNSIEGLELLAYIRLLSISWTESRTDQYMLEQIGGDWRLLSHMYHLKLSYFRHVIWASWCRIRSADRHGLWQKLQRQEKNTITDGTQKLEWMTLTRAVTATRDRVSRRRLVHDVTASQRTD